MAISQPITTDPLNVPDHALMHRIIATDPSAPVKTLTVDSVGRIAHVFVVEPNSPSIDTISKAMALAAAGDTILVAEGTYTEAVTFSQDNLTLRALGSAETTIITQAAADVVNFSTMSGCTLDGFTVSITAADASTDNCISSANDSATDYNTIENCIVIWTSSADLANSLVIHLTNGNTVVRNNRITCTNTHAEATTASTTAINPAGADTYWIYNNIITITDSATGASANMIGINLACTTAYIFNNIITMTAATEGGSTAPMGIYGAATTSYIMGNTITVTATSTGAAWGIKNPATSYIIGNFLNVTTGDSDGVWLGGAAGPAYACGNVIIGDAAYAAPTAAYLENNFIKTDAVWGGGDDPATSGVDIFLAGASIGADGTGTFFDDASTGAASTAIYKGNAVISVTFTGRHCYKKGDVDLKTGELVKLVGDKIYRTTVKKDPLAIGIYWGVTDWKDSFGNVYPGPEAYAVACVGDSYEDHDTTPLKGAYVTVDAGLIKAGDYLCSSDKQGYLEKQSDDIVHSYTRAKASKDINTDTQEAYIYLIS